MLYTDAIIHMILHMIKHGIGLVYFPTAVVMSLQLVIFIAKIPYSQPVPSSCTTYLFQFPLLCVIAAQL